MDFLTDAEYQVMESMWDTEDEWMSAVDILNRLRVRGDRHTKLEKLQLILRQLTEKECIELNTTKMTYQYRYLVTRDVFVRVRENRFLTYIFGMGRAGMFSFLRERPLKRKELKELEEYLDGLKQTSGEEDDSDD